MALPRGITIENGRLYQRPVREIEQYRSNKVECKCVFLDGVHTLEGIQGRTVDMEITIRPKDKEKGFQKFAVWFAQNEKYRTSVSFRPYESALKIDRKCSGSRRAFIYQRRSLVNTNDGEQVLTATVMTDVAANGISFGADGQVEMDITKYDLFEE